MPLFVSGQLMSVSERLGESNGKARIYRTAKVADTEQMHDVSIADEHAESLKGAEGQNVTIPCKLFSGTGANGRPYTRLSSMGPARVAAAAGASR